MGDTKKDFLTGSEIAIIGMACRLPGASTIEELWRNLCGGVESLTLLSDEDLRRAGVAAELAGNPNYVRRAALLEGVDLFDPAFFGYTALEAKIMDPQHRLFLECAWEVFEAAGYDPETYPAPRPTPTCSPCSPTARSSGPWTTSRSRWATTWR